MIHTSSPERTVIRRSTIALATTALIFTGSFVASPTYAAGTSKSTPSTQFSDPFLGDGSASGSIASTSQQAITTNSPLSTSTTTSSKTIADGSQTSSKAIKVAKKTAKKTTKKAAAKKAAKKVSKKVSKKVTKKSPKKIAKRIAKKIKRVRLIP
jgi:hypothetical protein